VTVRNLLYMYSGEGVKIGKDGAANVAHMLKVIEVGTTSEGKKPLYIRAPASWRVGLQTTYSHVSLQTFLRAGGHANLER
jgi:hypothetical protein